MNYWLVVRTPLQNISQSGWIFLINIYIYIRKNKRHLPIHQPDYDWVLQQPWGPPGIQMKPTAKELMDPRELRLPRVPSSIKGAGRGSLGLGWLCCHPVMNGAKKKQNKTKHEWKPKTLGVVGFPGYLFDIEMWQFDTMCWFRLAKLGFALLLDHTGPHLASGAYRGPKSGFSSGILLMIKRKEADSVLKSSTPRCQTCMTLYRADFGQPSLIAYSFKQTSPIQPKLGVFVESFLSTR